MENQRFQAVADASKKKPVSVMTPVERPSEYFAKKVFNRQKMYKYLPADVYSKLIDVIDNGVTVADASIAAAVPRRRENNLHSPHKSNKKCTRWPQCPHFVPPTCRLTCDEQAPTRQHMTASTPQVRRPRRRGWVALLPLALLAINNPVGVIFAGIFMAMLDIVGMQLTNLTAYNEYITDVIISVIVYLSAFSLANRMMLYRKKMPHAHVEETAAPAADAAPPEEPAEEPTELAEPAAAQTEEGGDQA